MSVIGNNILMGAAGQGGGYVIDNSLRFRASASAYLSRTPASAGNRKTWTWSGWVKRGALPTSGYYSIFGADSGSGQSFYVSFENSTQQFEIGQGATVYRKTTQVFRDTSAWYHLVVQSDTTQATASNRLRVYINGVQITAFATSNDPSLNGDWALNNNVAHSVGADIPNTGARNYLDGYLTEVNFIDGQALDATSFGEFNEDTGVWQPVKYAGTYGTNGFYLNFSDNTTTTTLGEDGSGNGNDWTANNISLTSGATYDSMTDTPTPYADGGNYAVLNPLVRFGASDPSGVFAEGNLKVTNTAGSGGVNTSSTIAVNSGKWYQEVKINAAGTGIIVGMSKVAAYTNSFYVLSTTGATSGLTITSGSGFTYTTGDTIGVAVDMDSTSVTYYKNGTQQLTATFSAVDEPRAFWNQLGTSSASVTANFGQRPFAYTPPAGFLSLHTGNLPDSAIVDGSKYFNPVLYTGNGSTQSITGVGFQPDFTWFKTRNSATHHALVDAVRGVDKYIYSSLTAAEETQTNALSSFDVDGFSFAGSFGNVNRSGDTYAAWNWKANGAGASNSDGSITSTVSANPTAGFSIVTYTGDGNLGGTVGHGLGVAPSLIICKERTATGNWPVYHKSVGKDGVLILNLTNGTTSSSNYWGSGGVTSTVFGTSTATGASNGTNQSIVAYCFAEVEGYSKFGSYTGNGSSDGPFVFTNFRPAFLAFKRTDSTSDWTIHDNRRLGYNTNNFELYPSGSYAETGSTSSPRSEFFANGFKIRGTSGGINASGGTYIYMAFSENPFKNSLAR